jgi:TRL-like protein family
MKKILLPVSVASLMVLATGCVGPNGPLVGAYGGLYTDVSGAVLATGNAKGTKVGTATSKGIIFVATGDSSIKAACDNGGITKIEHVDYHVTSVLGLYNETTVTVYGE